MNKKVKSEKNLNLKKNQEVSLTIEDFTKEGEGLGNYQGFPFFVNDGGFAVREAICGPGPHSKPEIKYKRRR